jgi:hypothetical protein
MLTSKIIVVEMDSGSDFNQNKLYHGYIKEYTGNAEFEGGKCGPHIQLGFYIRPLKPSLP